MKLRITHFYDPDPFLDGNISVEDYSEAHSAWKARQVKPEESEEVRRCLIEGTFDKRYQCHFDNWQKALQHYEENKLRFKDFKATKMHTGLELTFEPTYSRQLKVTIHNGEQVDLRYYEMIDGEVFMLHFYNGLSVSLFEQICSENNIELKLI